MFSFRFIFFTAAAFATVASAISTAPPASNNVGADSIDCIIDSLGNVRGDSILLSLVTIYGFGDQAISSISR